MEPGDRRFIAPPSGVLAVRWNASGKVRQGQSHKTHQSYHRPAEASMSICRLTESRRARGRRESLGGLPQPEIPSIRITQECYTNCKILWPPLYFLLSGQYKEPIGPR